MLRDPDIGVRTEALLYLSREAGIDPLRQIQELGDFQDFSIRAGAAAFLAAPGRSQNLEAARVILEGMATSAGAEGQRDRTEAARLIGTIGDPNLIDLLHPLITDEDADVARQAVRSAHRIAREELVPTLIMALGRQDITDDVADALARFGNVVVPQVAVTLRNDDVSVDVRRELPSVLARIATAEAERALVDSLLESDGTVRHRIIASLNKLRNVRPDIQIDPTVVELLLAAEIAGHYRSYQVLGPLRTQLKDDDPALEGLRHSMEQELERIFRLMALLFPQAGLHDAYVGVRSSNPIVRANALEFLDNVLKPELRHVLVPLLDSHVTLDERIELGNTPGWRPARHGATVGRDDARKRRPLAPIVCDPCGGYAAAALAGARAQALRSGGRPARAAVGCRGAGTAGRRFRGAAGSTASGSRRSRYWRRCGLKPFPDPRSRSPVITVPR